MISRALGKSIDWLLTGEEKNWETDRLRQVVLPGPIRRRLGICAGDPPDAKIEQGRIVLTPRRKRSRAGKIVTDLVTGLPVLSVGTDAPALSSKEVEEILRSFP